MIKFQRQLNVLIGYHHHHHHHNNGNTSLLCCVAKQLFVRRNESRFFALNRIIFFDVEKISNDFNFVWKGTQF